MEDQMGNISNRLCLSHPVIRNLNGKSLLDPKKEFNPFQTTKTQVPVQRGIQGHCPDCPIDPELNHELVDYLKHPLLDH
jgi:hypothetical protein